MKFFMLSALIVMISLPSVCQTLEVLVENGNPDKYINVVILGDGYTAADHAADQLRSDATSFMNAMLDESPFSEYADFFNFYIIKRNSAEQGADHPAHAADEASSIQNPPCPAKTVNTAYDCTFDHDSIHRLLVPLNTTLAFADADALLPGWDQLIMLVNDPCYGGSGGTIATASVHISSNEIAIHEMGHSFALLADEYYAGDQFAIERANKTMDSNMATIKWKNWLNQNGITIHQHTCPYTDANGQPDPSICQGLQGFDEFDQWYKPHNNCLMQYLPNRDFCSVCKEAIVDQIYNLVSPVLGKRPNQNTVFMFNGSEIEFGSNLIEPTTGLTLEWLVNGNLDATRTNGLETFTYDDLDTDFTGVTLRVIDETALSKTYLPDDGYIFELSWTLQKIDLCGGEIVDNFTFDDSFSPTTVAGQTTNDDFDWLYIDQGGTPTNGTGPSAPYDGQGYIYAEATGNTPEKLARLNSGCFDLTRLNQPRLNLALHMVGPDVGSLEIIASPTAGNSEFQTIFFHQGQYASDWKEIELPLGSVASPYTRFRFIAKTSTGDVGDIAIDRMRIYDRCPDTQVLNSAHTQGGTIRAAISITSSDVVTSTTTYQAGDRISLNQGFETLVGRTFTAQIAGCDQ